MQNHYEEEKMEYEKKLYAQIRGIHEILKLNMNGLLENDVTEKLSQIKSKAERLSEKLSNDEFEISIVGLEKAGKSSFANAMMGINILPSKEARCTYTSTSIRYGKNNAKVKFFSHEEFAKGFQDKLRVLGIEHPETYTYETLSLENYRKLFENLDQTTKLCYGGTLNEDIQEILKYKNNLKSFIGTGAREFSGESELEGDYFKGFIQDPKFAIAVKEITIYSDKFQKMKNAIIYDVPGFDSPTQMHKEQTLQKMRTADAIILIVPAYKPNFTDSAVEIFRKESDEDGIRFDDKMFVFANMADRVENLQEDMDTLRGELRKYRIMSDSLMSERILAGSAKARLEAEGKIEGKEASAGIEKRGIEDGIDTIINRLENYNQTIRFEVLKGKINRLQSDIRNVFENKLSDEEYLAFDSSKEVAGLVLDLVDESRNAIKEEIEDYRKNFKDEYSPKSHLLTDKMRQEIIHELTVSNSRLGAEISAN